MRDLRKPSSLRITVEDWEDMRAYVAGNTSEEMCGIIAGTMEQDYYQAYAIVPTTNELHSPVRFRIEAQEQLQAFYQIEEQGWEVVGIFHSHPQGPDEPSHTDIAEAYYAEAIHLIWSCRTGAWKCRGFLIQEGVVQEVSSFLAR
jgi:proteasome lid subunit RPN8/RPN11